MNLLLRGNPCKSCSMDIKFRFQSTEETISMIPSVLRTQSPVLKNYKQKEFRVPPEYGIEEFVQMNDLFKKGKVLRSEKLESLLYYFGMTRALRNPDRYVFFYCEPCPEMYQSENNFLVPLCAWNHSPLLRQTIQSQGITDGCDFVVWNQMCALFERGKFSYSKELQRALEYFDLTSLLLSRHDLLAQNLLKLSTQKNFETACEEWKFRFLKCTQSFFRNETVACLCTHVIDDYVFCVCNTTNNCESSLCYTCMTNLYEKKPMDVYLETSFLLYENNLTEGRSFDHFIHEHTLAPEDKQFLVHIRCSFDYSERQEAKILELLKKYWYCEHGEVHRRCTEKIKTSVAKRKKKIKI